jgi:DNA-binding NarL/FixJ family response regulator
MANSLQSLFQTMPSVKQALKRMFRKLEVSSRAEMIARLSSYHKTFPLTLSLT